MMKAYYCYSCRKSFGLRIAPNGPQNTTDSVKCFYCDSDFIEELSQEMTVQLLPTLMHDQAVYLAQRHSPGSPHVQVISQTSQTTATDDNQAGGSRPIPVPMHNLFQNLSESLRNLHRNPSPSGSTEQPTGPQQGQYHASGSSGQYNWAVHSFGPESFAVTVSSPNINFSGTTRSSTTRNGDGAADQEADSTQAPSTEEIPSDLEGILNLITQITGNDSVLRPMFRMFGLSGNPRDYVITGQFEDLLDQFFRLHQPNLVGMSDEEIERCLKKIEAANFENVAGTEGGCAVCKEDFVTPPQNDTLIRVLPCGHIFHNDCIVPWLKRVASCPICRTNPVTEYDKQTTGASNPPRPSN